MHNLACAVLCSRWHGMCLLRFLLRSSSTLPSFEVVLDRAEEGSFLNIYKLWGDSVAKGRGRPTRAAEETASPKKANQTNGTKSYFSDGYCKRSLCVLKKSAPTDTWLSAARGRTNGKKDSNWEYAVYWVGGGDFLMRSKRCILGRRAPSGGFWSAFSPEGLGVESGCWPCL